MLSGVEAVDVVLIMHVEGDLVNKRGERSKIAVEEQSFNHVSLAIDVLSKELGELPLNVALKYGGSVGDRLVKSKAVQAIPRTWEVELHPHGEKPSPRGWVEEPCRPEDIRRGVRDIVDVLGIEPRGLVFGDWLITREGLEAARESGLSHDASYAPYRFNESFVVKPPFNLLGLIEAPVLSDGQYPVNAVTSPLVDEIISYVAMKTEGKNCLLHLYFHSYDLFDFHPSHCSLRKDRLKSLKRVLDRLRRLEAKFLRLTEVELKYSLYLKELRLSPFDKVKATLRRALG